MPLATDQIGRQIEVPEYPERIVSLVPSQTELLSYFALDERVVGITKFCIHPKQWHKSKVRVGGTKILKFTVIDELKPDLILANKEENTRESIEKLGAEYPVWVSNVNSFEDALDMIQGVGEITNSEIKALQLKAELSSSFDDLENYVSKNGQAKRVLYLIWQKPYMAVGKQTFINDMLEKCGFTNVITDTRYPELKLSDIIRLAPDLVLFSSEPYPFKEHHMDGIRKLLPHAQLQLVDGETFSWYGNRLLNSVPYFKKLIETIS